MEFYTGESSPVATNRLTYLLLPTDRNVTLQFLCSESILLFTQELVETRRRGRPRKGWKEEMERDLQVLGVRRWRELVADRKKWKDIVRQAKAHSGL